MSDLSARTILSKNNEINKIKHKEHKTHDLFPKFG
jgi:hypothetical protein